MATVSRTLSVIVLGVFGVMTAPEHPVEAYIMKLLGATSED